MLPYRLMPIRAFSSSPISCQSLPSSQLRLALQKSLQPQRPAQQQRSFFHQRLFQRPRPVQYHKLTQKRSYASQKTSPSATRAEDELKRQARAATLKTGTKMELPEKLVIYHAGTGAMTFLSMVKITSLFVGVFFIVLVAPSYMKADKPPKDVAAVTLFGLIPVLFVLYTGAPFVTHIYIHLPPAARASRAVLERWVRALPPTAELTITTMSAIGKPRYSIMQAADLVPARRRLGVVNYVRDTQAENAQRKWYNFRAVGQFFIRDQSTRKARYEKKNLVEGWIWDAIKDKIAKRAAPAPPSI